MNCETNTSTAPSRGSQAGREAVAAGELQSVIVVGDFGSINGGQAKVAIESALGLKARGLDVVFFAGIGPLDDRLERAGIECHVVGEHTVLSDPNLLGAAVSGIWNRRAARLLRDCIASRDPETTIIHLHGWAKALSPSIVREVTEAKAAHLFTLHEYFLACPNGGFYDYQEERICERRAMGPACLVANCDARNFGHKLWRVARQAGLRTAGGANRIRELAYLVPKQRTIVEPYFGRDTRMHLLPNPIPAGPDDRVRCEDNRDFLFIGRFSAEKGADVAAAAAREAGVPITFCGDGPLQPALEEINPNARFPGWLNEDELAEQLGRARCLVFPSKWYECSPLVIGEAFRAGVPIISSYQIVSASFISEGGNGLLVPPNDVGALAKAMRRFASDDTVREMSIAAFASGRQFPDEDEHLTCLLEVYGDCIDRNRRDGAR